ncbi:TRAP transporter substrate-binding protein [Aureimonas glaciei]|uniref:Transporter n=1 Tax=Aureimonas glaciei TaxID=1776957 RepID=A0A917DI96_9HYPH|nr:TRAP transporter substrate-binding protein [Aureimonas glaciei]GGD39965.1 transporter [Aureimonas glaciei]
MKITFAKTGRARLAALTLAALAAGAAHADPLPETNLRVIGNFSSGVQVQRVEKPFWTQDIPARSDGKITVEYNNYDVMGIKEQQMIRLSEAGIADFASTDIVKLAGDDPIFEGCDLTGVSPDIATVHKACDAWLPVVARVLETKFNTKLLGLSPNQGLVFWCRDEIAGLSDISGKKVRVNSRTMGDMIVALGGTPVTTPFADVVPSLQRGVFDCAITGSMSGNTSGWAEVSKYMFPLPVNWSISYQSANLASWNGFAPEVRTFLEEQFKDLDTRLWAIGEQAHDEGVNCNTGQDPCTLGKKAAMTLVPVSDADKETIKTIARDKIVLEWAKRCGKECAQEWNDTVGKVVDIQIPLEQI